MSNHPCKYSRMVADHFTCSLGNQCMGLSYRCNKYEIDMEKVVDYKITFTLNNDKEIFQIINTTGTKVFSMMSNFEKVLKDINGVFTISNKHSTTLLPVRNVVSLRIESE